MRHESGDAGPSRHHERSALGPPGGARSVCDDAARAATPRFCFWKWKNCQPK